MEESGNSSGEMVLLLELQKDLIKVKKVNAKEIKALREEKGRMKEKIGENEVRKKSA